MDSPSDNEEIHDFEICRGDLDFGFGFSISGGSEWSSPLYVHGINEGGAAHRDSRLWVSMQILFSLHHRCQGNYWITGG